MDDHKSGFGFEGDSEATVSEEMQSEVDSEETEEYEGSSKRRKRAAR